MTPLPPIIWRHYHLYYDITTPILPTYTMTSLPLYYDVTTPILSTYTMTSLPLYYPPILWRHYHLYYDITTPILWRHYHPNLPMSELQRALPAKIKPGGQTCKNFFYDRDILYKGRALWLVEGYAQIVGLRHWFLYDVTNLATMTSLPLLLWRHWLLYYYNPSLLRHH